MLSCLIRATTRTFVRVLVIALTLALFCGSFSWDAFARATDRRPCELPGDGDSVGGYKDYVFETVPAAVSDRQWYQPRRPDIGSSRKLTLLQLVMLTVQLHLAARR
jgi:hypothetical protein